LTFINLRLKKNDMKVFTALKFSWKKFIGLQAENAAFGNFRAFRHLLTLSVCLINVTLPSKGQENPCANGRYGTDMFANVTESSGILYGVNTVRDYSMGTDSQVQLYLDFFEPTGDTQSQRPLIIFAFGGSFVTGQRTDMYDLCRAFAKKGYVTATIDYRLVPAGANGINYALVFNSRARLADQLVRASSDMKAAIRFFRRDAATTNTYRVDPNRIFVAGYSAGAIMALQTAYINSEAEDSNFTAAYQANGGIEGNTDLPAPNNSLPSYNANNLSGVLSLAGALPSVDVLTATNPPLFAAHGDADTTVPYNSGPVFGGSAYTMYGGGALYTKAIATGLNAQLYTIVGGNHASTRQDPDRIEIISRASTFFQQIICPTTLPVTLTAFEASLDKSGQLSVLWKTAAEANNSHFILQLSKDGKSWKDLVRKEAAANASAGASYHVDMDFSALGLAGFGILGILLLPVSNRRYRLWACLALCAVVGFSCAKDNQVRDVDFFNSSRANTGTFYLRLAQFDKDGKVTYSSSIAVKPEL
jgi:acetyl esterase/lipase